MHKRSALRDAEKYAVLAELLAPQDGQDGTHVNHRDVGGYRTKTVRAGEFIYVSCYPLINAKADSEQKLRLKEMETMKKSAKLRAKFARYNNARRVKEFEWLVHANMVKGDLHIVCTYEFDDYSIGELQEKTREEAKRDRGYFIRKVKRLLKRHGCDLKEFRWIAVTVTKHRMEDAVRPWPDSHHHHILVHGVPEELRTAVEKLWTYGYCNADRLQDSEKGFAAMSGYIARQEGSANGERAWEKSFSCSRNIIRPTICTSDSRISRRRVSRIAEDVRVNGKEIFEKLYLGYRLTEEVRTVVSDFVAGAYIYAKLRRAAFPDESRRRRC